jgi:hypothetical protein
MAVNYAVVSVTSSHINYQLSNAKIREDIEELVEDDEIVTFHKLEDFDNSTFLEAIVKHTGCDVVDGVKIFIGEKFYQAMFVPQSNVEIFDSSKVNMLGTQITNGIPTLNPVVIFKYKVKSDTEIEFDNLTYIDLVSILEDKFFHTGVFIKLNPDESYNMEQYTYQQHILDATMDKYSVEYINENFLTDEIELGDMIFKIAHNKNAPTVNKKLSKIVGHTVNGDVWCGLYYKPDHTRESTFISINKDHVLKILEILHNAQFNSCDHYKNITTETAENITDKDVSQLVISPYTNIDRLYRKYKKIV